MKALVIKAAAAVALLAAIPGAGFAQAGVSFVGHVPVVCRVELDSAPAAALHAGDNSLGNMNELCNTASGYRLVLDHPAGLIDAFVIIDGQQVPLSASGTSTVIVDSDVPAERRRPLQLHLAQLPAEAASDFTLRAEAKTFF
jgi:hypothetical protein